MILREHISKEQGLPDLLNYAYHIGNGVIVNKDGAFMLGFRFRGPDTYSASDAELNALTANFNRMASILDDGWMLHIDNLRTPSTTYPAQGYFPNSVASLIDEERRILYEAEGTHFENLQLLTFVWKWPITLVKNTKHLFIEGLEKTDKDDQSLTTLLDIFNDKVERCVGLLSSNLLLEKLSISDFLSALHASIAGELLPINTPEGVFLDAILGRNPVVGGYIPKVGNKNIYVLSIVGYLNNETIPGILDELATYPILYRWSNRFIPLSEATAEREIKRYQKHWRNKVKGFTGIVKEAVFGRATDKINVDALQMANETSEALTANSNRSVRFGYWTSALILMHDQIAPLDEVSKALRKYLEQRGFTCIKEDVNAMDAWLGSIPGHGSCNVRRVFLNSINLAHVLPLHSIYAGHPYSSKSSLLPLDSSPVFYAATTGKTPFRFHLDVADVGHQIVLGPTGAGKSTWLGFLIAQFLRYEKAQIFVFDKDYSHQALTLALGGLHYNIGNAATLAFCPLANLSTDTHCMRAETFIETLIALQGVAITPTMRSAIHDAISALAREEGEGSRNITVLRSMIQEQSAREALKYYTLEGQFKLLDATHDSLQTHYLQTFEMGWLLSQKPEIYLPVLLYIFDQIEDRLEQRDGKSPTLIILEEAWLYISHEVFANKLRDWLKTLRKKNARVIFATQSLSDLYDPQTKTLTKATSAIMESCPTKIYLPNPKMEAEAKSLYQKIGLTERQLDIISNIAIPKRHYYVVTPEGNRLIDFGFNDVKALTLAFIGLSKENSKALIECIKNHGDGWPYYWLKSKGFNEWAECWRNKNDSNFE